MDYNSLEYYSAYIFGLIVVYLLLVLIFQLLKNRNTTNLDKSLSFDYYGIKEHIQVVHDELTSDQSSLRRRYLIAAIIVKSAFWVKTPYLFALYNRLHGFNREEIAVLIALENLTSVILGPIIGSLNDLLGRKKFCVSYCFLVILNIALRLTGSRSLAYGAQVVAGLGSVLIDASFESWLNFEASRYFSDDKEGQIQKNSYLREVFTKQIYIDSLSGIVLTGFATMLYNSYGIFYPFYLCILLCLIGAIFIMIEWNENAIKNEPGKDNQSFIRKITFSWQVLKSDKPLFAVGIIESTFKICISLWGYMWTPLLENSAQSFINVGVIYGCFMMAKLIGCEFFDGMKRILKTNTYLITLFVTVTACFSFYIDYSYESFHTRLISLMYFDGMLGTFQPLMSSLKSQMIPEGQRTTIMTFFRIPINICSILTLYFSTYITIYEICLIAMGIMVVSSITTILLLIWHHPPDAEQRKVFKTTQLHQHHELEDAYFHQEEKIK